MDRADELARELLAVKPLPGIPAVTGPATVLMSPAAASFDMFVRAQLHYARLV